MGKSVGDMIDTDVNIAEDGSVTGTLKYVTGYTEFSNNADEQTGNYFPVKLKVSGSKLSILKNGIVIVNNIPFDPDIVLRVTAPTDTFKIEVDGKEIATFSFTKATLNKA